MLFRPSPTDLGNIAARPLACPYCQGIAHGHGRNRHRRIVDTRLSEIEQRRFRCTRCGRTFQSRPQGVSRGAQRSERLKGYGVSLYALGLSYRQVVVFLNCQVGRVGASTVYRDVQRAGQRAQEFHRRGCGQVRLAGVDGTGQGMKGTKPR